MEDEATQPGDYDPRDSFLRSFAPSPSPTYPSPISPQITPYAYDSQWVATQQVIDPRRLGQANSGLNHEDLADIFCILHPTSLPAHKAAALIHEYNEHHTISTQSDVKIRERDSKTHDELGSFELDAEGVASCDIALRLSGNLKDSLGGYRFGRNKQRCDFVLGVDDEVKRVSNIHFRIYINEYGVIMLEDQSTNGTAVDGILLKAKDKENGLDFRHTLEQGSMITLHMTPPEEDFRFIVRIPQRDEEAEIDYNRNLTNYFNRINNAKLERQKQARVGGATANTREPPNIFATPDASTPDPSLSMTGRYVKEWRGGTKYNKVGTIGKGAFATVYKLTTKYNGVPYAAKELEKRRFMKNGILDQKVEMEMKIMQKIKHANIVQYIEHVDWEEYLYIIMEYVPGGDLGSLISRNGRLPEMDVKVMASQLLSALKYLHCEGITHRDVKPDNILIYSHKPLQVKLTDFGLSKMVDSEETFLRTFCGTLLYCAPEVYSEYREYDHAGRRNLRGLDKKSLPPQRYDDAVDVWSLAGVLFYALCGSPPYPVKNGTTYQELLNHIMTQPLDIRPLQLAEVSESGIRFVRAMLHNRPEYRATIEELENAPWLSGDDSIAMSIEDDEVDMIGDGLIDPELQDGASQLSIHDAHKHQIKDSQGEIESVSDVTEIQQREIPSSFNTSDDNSNGSYGFSNALADRGNGRLFGEVNIASLGSSGAIPLDHLPIPIVNHRVPDSHLHPELSQESYHTPSQLSNDSPRIQNGTQPPRPVANPLPMPMLPPPPPINQLTPSNDETDEHAARSSSLMGAESLVGHLNMHSPSSAVSPTADVPAPSAYSQDPTVSLRRRREEEGEYDDQGWRPHDLPPKKRRRSEREIDLPVPPSLFWDPRDPSTHHSNYPRMSVSDVRNYQEYAKAKGELFEHGQKTFDATMQSFRSSRSPSLEPDAATRARSEPIRDNGLHNLMKRDERQLGVDSVGKTKPIEPQAIPSLDRLMPMTASGSNEPIHNTIENDPPPNSNSMALQPAIGNDFQPPMRILAKLLSTPDSCLPTINLNLTENLTSWGRGSKNTVRYVIGTETRVPKYAFKILLFKSGFYNPTGSPNSSRNGNRVDQDMTFYISSKASAGIRINGVELPSFDRQNPYTPSKFWGEIRHGDLISVWFNDAKPDKLFTRFKFECYCGKSKETRHQGEIFSILPQGEMLNEIECVCLAIEKDMIAEIEHRDEQDKKIRDQDKKARQSVTKLVGVNQSLVATPPPPYTQ